MKPVSVVIPALGDVPLLRRAMKSLLLDIFLGLYGFDVRGDEGADEADEDSDGGHSHREDHGVPSSGHT